MTTTLENVTVTFRKTAALSAVSTSLQDGLIYGLIGRNGAGKTTLLSLLASYRRPDNGVVRIDGDDPFENAQLMRSVHFVFPRDVSDESDSVRTTLEHCARYRRDFDLDWAFALARRFRLDLRKSLSELSLGLQSAVNAIEGLASGAALTMFDEVHHGMDPHSRTLFYEALLDRREQTGRTFILSTHLVSEMAYLFDHVLILDEGRLIVDEPCDIVSERGTTVIGPLPEVEAFTRERRVIDRKALGGTASFMLDGSLTDRDREQAQQAGLEIAPVSLQDLFIHLTAQEHT
jgi:ABC-2 type transport system ATP-binding protein